MNQIVKALKAMEAEAGKSGRWNLETLCKMAALEIETKAASITDLTLTRGEDEKRIVALEATIARLTADAKLNDMAWTDNQAALKAQAAEIKRLRGVIISYQAGQQ